MKTCPFVISLPHCAGRVPVGIRQRMAISDKEIEDAVDHGTYEIFSGEIFSGPRVQEVLAARYSRLFCDLNRSPRNRGYKGVVPETDYKGRHIFHPGMYPDDATIENWIMHYFRPWHERLEKAVFSPGVMGLFDCHSLNGIGPVAAPDAGRKRKDVIISNNGGKSGQSDPESGDPTCPVHVVEIVEAAFLRAGFSTAVNDPYTGGFITVHYGRRLVRQGAFALQIEMNQDLYLDPATERCDFQKTAFVAGRAQAAFEEIARRLA